MDSVNRSPFFSRFVGFLLDRLQTISNLARFGPPKAYLEKVKKRQQRKLISDARRAQGRNAVSKDGDGEAKGLVGGQSNIGDKPTKKPLEGRVLWNILAGKKATKRSEEEIEAIRKEYKIGLTKHLSSLFEDGVSDSRDGKNEPPGNVKTIEHAGGELLSWIPQRYRRALRVRKNSCG